MTMFLRCLECQHGQNEKDTFVRYFNQSAEDTVDRHGVAVSVNRATQIDRAYQCGNCGSTRVDWRSHTKATY